ncbi:ABC transporter permease subunit [Lysinibacillus sp. LZ02]|uniref:ABC transporter permease subunit n=1 Tax=Lysinibacillus sp. LZ02 TaxID=3420668 RepID=UPI003D36810C
MSDFVTLFSKECREAWRGFKFLWMPLLFILLGISDPLMNYFMEDILNAVGNLPEGFSITLPNYLPIDLLYASTGQFQSIGLIVLVVTFAGTISRERQNGTATLIYVRPISFATFFMSKWAVASLLGIMSAIAGYTGSMYYTAILYGPVEIGAFIKMVLTYCVWVLFVAAVTIALSAMFKTAIAITMAIVLLPVGLIMDSLIGSFWSVTPWKLATYGVQFISGGTSEHYTITLIFTCILMVIAMIIGIVFTKKNAATTKI